MISKVLVKSSILITFYTVTCNYRNIADKNQAYLDMFGHNWNIADKNQTYLA